MRGLLAYAGMMLRLQFRYRLAVFYSFLFPLIFLVAFRIFYRWQEGHITDHFGELLAIAILGGTCFGLPVTMVAERERGVWRRYRLLPTPIWTLVGGTMGVRFVLLVGAGILQLLLALAVGMPAPAHLADVAVAFSAVAFVFCGFGLIVAMLVNSVAAAQAMGQCIFLPMLVLGGMARRLDQLPVWTQQLAAFTPGRYAVNAIQTVSMGGGLGTVRYDLAVLVFMGAAAGVSAAKMFRWDVHTGHARRSRLGWLTVTLAACLIVGFSTLRREAAAAQLEAMEAHQTPTEPAPAEVPPPVPRPEEELLFAAEKAESWQVITIPNLLELPRRLPPDRGVVAPIAAAEDDIDADTRAQAMAIYEKLAKWAPGNVTDPVERVRNLLNLPAMVDVLQLAPLEQFIPVVTEWYLHEVVPAPDLVRILGWLACHPLTGELVSAEEMEKLEIEVPGRVMEVRARLQIYAAKLMFRLLDDPDSGAIPKASVPPAP